MICSCFEGKIKTNNDMLKLVSAENFLIVKKIDCVQLNKNFTSAYFLHLPVPSNLTYS